MLDIANWFISTYLVLGVFVHAPQILRNTIFSTQVLLCKVHGFLIG